jgi:hypothetical protein
MGCIRSKESYPPPPQGDDGPRWQLDDPDAPRELETKERIVVVGNPGSRSKHHTRSAAVEPLTLFLGFSLPQGVGKSSLVYRGVQDEFPESTDVHVGVEFVRAMLPDAVSGLTRSAAENKVYECWQSTLTNGNCTSR